jgi:cytochrome c peroxidase
MGKTTSSWFFSFRVMKKYFSHFLFLLLSFSLIACGGGNSTNTNNETPPLLSKVQLGEKLFSDINLSLSRTQSCATCHNPDHAFMDSRVNALQKAVSTGHDGLSFGDRNTPTASYAKFSPVFHRNMDNEFIGGQFLDGKKLDLKGQASQPPLNPVEMGMPDKMSIVIRLQESDEYVPAFQALFGTTIFEDSDKAYSAMTETIAEFEKTEQFNPFNSKYDRSLRSYQGNDKYILTIQEQEGRALFFSKTKTNCNLCHQLKQNQGALEETFSNYEFHNLGVPKNIAVRNANGKGQDFIDHGLLDNPIVITSQNSEIQNGKFKVATLRNVAVTAPYMHNGIFQNLRTVILFYDKFNNSERISNPDTGLAWRSPEVAVNLALQTEKFIAPILSDKDINALIAFLSLLTDKRYEHLIP